MWILEVQDGDHSGFYEYEGKKMVSRVEWWEMRVLVEIKVHKA